MEDLINKTAIEIVDGLRSGVLSPHDLLDVLERRVDAVENQVNALPILCFGRARRHADALLARPLEERGLLCGLPMPIKDLDDVKGVRTSFGSLPFRDNVAEVDSYFVEHLEAQGTVIFAKSNSPEFGAGGNTFNDVFGITRNPHDLSRTAGGSSGGAAASLASGTSWLAQGSDNAGSLRTPASFCGVVGFRASPGRVARGPVGNPYQTLIVNGPMARNVADTALFLDALTVTDTRDVLTYDPPRQSFLSAARSMRRPLRVAFSPDLGITPVDPEVAAICEAAARHFEAMGVPVEFAAPDYSGVHESYQTLRAFEFAIVMQDMVREHRSRIKPELVQNVEKGMALGFDDISRAMLVRGQIRQRVLEFFQDYDLLLCPTTIVPPFPAEQRYVRECGGVTFKTYIDWLALAYAVTLVSIPSISIPCGKTRQGLPVGVQMVGRPRADAALLSHALCLEQSLGLDLGPIDPVMRDGNG